MVGNLQKLQNSYCFLKYKLIILVFIYNCWLNFFLLTLSKFNITTTNLTEFPTTFTLLKEYIIFHNFDY